MLFHRFETPGIAHYSYLIGEGREAAVVDPRRDVEEYLAVARAMDVQIRYVIETHRQEDFVMGATHLAERTGAQVVNGKHDYFGHGDVRLDHGDSFRVGSLTIRALHTPGHTPESMCYAIFGPELPDRAWGVLTGDTLFFGDTGRTDLLDPKRSTEHAAELYDSVHERLGDLGDGALVLPAHGPGSVCGRGMVPRPMSTLGAERAYNPVFTLGREAFAARKGAERIPRPPYFRFCEKVNLKGGIPPAADPDEIPLLSADEVAGRSASQTVLDARGPEAFAGGHVPGSYALWLGGLPSFGGWIASHDTPLLLVLARQDDRRQAIQHLSRIGIDRVEGVLAGGFGSWRDAGRPFETSGIIAPRELAEQLDQFQVLDVREPGEVEESQIAGARNVYVGHLEQRLRGEGLGFDRERPVAVTCSVGNRAGLAVSILRRHDFRDVRNLLGGMTAWTNSGLSTRRTE